MSPPSSAAPSPTSSAQAAVVRALQDTLGAEHAAVYGYGVVGGRLSGSAQNAALTDFDTHRALRDDLIALLTARGATPQAAAPAYTLPFAVATSADASRLAVHLEEGLADFLTDLVAAADGDLRTTAAHWLQDSAVRATRWRGSSTPFPGLPERAQTSPVDATGASSPNPAAT